MAAPDFYKSAGSRNLLVFNLKVAACAPFSNEMVGRAALVFTSELADHPPASGRRFPGFLIGC
jgi:hypothetical protein